MSRTLVGCLSYRRYLIEKLELLDEEITSLRNSAKKIELKWTAANTPALSLDTWSSLIDYFYLFTLTEETLLFLRKLL